MRQKSQGNPDVLNAIAMTQYQEVQGLRAEIDELHGFGFEQTADLVVSIEGTGIGFGRTPSSILSDNLNNLRLAIQSIAGCMLGKKHMGTGRLPRWIAYAADLSVREISSGNLKLALSLPPFTSEFTNSKHEPIKRSIELLLQAICWVSSDDDVQALSKIALNERLQQVVLRQVDRITPSETGAVRLMQFSGRLISTPEPPILTPQSANRVAYALNILGAQPMPKKAS